VPWSLAAEQALIACVILDEQQAWSEGVADIVSLADFFLPEHKDIWRAMLHLREEGLPIGWLSMVVALSELSLLDKIDHEVGSTEVYLVEITGQHYAATGASMFARMVKDYSERRKLIQEAQTMVRDAYDVTKPLTREDRSNAGGFE